MSSVAVALLVAEVELVRWSPKLTNEPKSDGSLWHLRRRDDSRTFCGQDLSGMVAQKTYVEVTASSEQICEHCTRARLQRLLSEDPPARPRPVVHP